MSHHEAKIAAGKKAAEWIADGMIVGLGSGSTAECFIDSLIELCKEGLKIEAVASSRASAERARKGGIAVMDINSVPRIDITVDGADEIDSEKRMIKGGGGAHVREKILAAASKEMVVIVDESKLVGTIGRAKLPVEVLFFGSPSTRKQIEEMGYKGKWRLQKDGTLFITENGNLLFDIQFESPPLSPEQDHFNLTQIPGVVDTGFFFRLAGRVIIGYPDGTTRVQ
ncbi:MAG: ribose 5-phosphate isomerase A [Chlamydiae bacterium RIFCSPHIGHO2_12_FULL_49_9]|nr:MAG: ribose 5-phosphate isomerase A [Chlamydiae bacterium RIFCSPHIGHO2_12_FULL_49_9]